jgi:MFS family permease
MVRGLAAERPVGSVLRYYLYKATTAVEFYRPIMYLYFLDQGLSFTSIAVLEALYNLATVFGEVPTGYVGDRVGRRHSLLIGTGLIAATLVGIGGVGVVLPDDPTLSFAALATLYVCWSMGYNFRSGSEDAWLYDTLTEELSEEAFARIRGRGESVSLLVGVVGAVLGGYLGSLNLTYPFFFAAGVTALGAVVLLSMGDPEIDEEADADELGIGESLATVRESLTRPDLRAFVVYYYVLFAAITYLVFIFLQPVFETVVVAELGVARTRVESLLGWFYAAYSLVGAGLSYETGAIREWIGVRTWFLVLPPLVGVALLGSWFVPLLALPTLLLTRGIADTTRSLASQYVNDRVDSLGRATVLSAMAMVSGLAVVPFQLGSGAISDLTSPSLALAVAGGVLLVGSILIWVVLAPIPREAVRGTNDDVPQN